MSLPADIESCAVDTTASLEELVKTHGQVQQVAEHCRAAFREGDQDSAFQETKGYVTDTLQNVVYQIHNVSLQIANFMDVQFKEIDKLDLQIRTLSDRMKACHDATGASDKQAMELPKNYVRADKMRKLEGSELPYSAQPLEPYVREPIDLSVLDDVGSTGITSHAVSRPAEY
eukprot:TRINITY_DN10966_c0_g1_i1.p1 TRINITY_DN10966_c0_g1~~TRINITY_DN10966_c0_g1_i1.p1  ORF type:complete len:173 (+),score=36.18 TRINITY_DN10966_c0_g1_i1:47-565(+)